MLLCSLWDLCAGTDSRGWWGVQRVGDVVYVVMQFCSLQLVVERHSVSRRECVVDIAVVADWTATARVGVG